MRSCGFCGDRYDSDTVHECWVVEKLYAQENLPGPTYDYVPCRGVESDADWRERHGV